MLRVMTGIVILAITCTAAQSDDPAMNKLSKIDAAIYDRAKSEGVVRVIVQVQASPAEELASAGPSTRGLCANHACAKLSIERSLSPADAQSIKSLGEQPLLAMDVTPSGLEMLDASKFVVGVWLDEVSRTQPVDADPSREGGGSGPPGLSSPQ